MSGKDKILWDYLQQLLNDPCQRYKHVICWRNRYEGIFKIVDSALLSQLWGIKKNHPNMTYDKLSRSLRHYYKHNKLRKVPGRRGEYQFLFNEANLPNLDPHMALIMDMDKLDEQIDNQLKQETIMIKEEKVNDC